MDKKLEDLQREKFELEITLTPWLQILRKLGIP